jgi:hypothetical protein
VASNFEKKIIETGASRLLEFSFNILYNIFKLMTLSLRIGLHAFVAFEASQLDEIKPIPHFPKAKKYYKRTKTNLVK